jgi:hypothetical protein
MASRKLELGVGAEEVVEGIVGYSEVGSEVTATSVVNVDSVHAEVSGARTEVCFFFSLFFI